MKQFLLAVTAAALLGMTAAAQTAGQASGSANTSTGVQAGQANANVNSNTSANADAQMNRKQGEANAGGNASGDTSASVNGNSVGANGGAALATGTTIPATLTKSVDARKAKAGDEISAKTTEEVRSAAGVVIPRGSRLVGHVTDAKAKAKGDSESALGIAFDHALLRNGQQVPFNASIKAIAAAANNTSASMGDDNFGAGSGSAAGGGVSGPAAGSGAGGPLGGAGRTLGGATSAVGNTAGGVANTAGDLGANAGGAVNGTNRAATGQLTSHSQGVIGLNGLQLSSAASNSTQGSVITSAGKDVKLDSGTQLLLQVNQQ